MNVATFSIENGQTSHQIASPLFLHITSAFPSAWAAFFASNPSLFPGGATCSSSAVFSAPFGCFHPPIGTLVTISAGLSVQGLTITTITATVSIK